MASLFLSAIGTAGAGGGLLGLAAPAAGAAVGKTVATGAGAAASAGSGVLSLSRVLSIGSALASVGQGFAQARALREQAAFAEAQAEQEEAQGAGEARNLAREFAQMSGEQRAIQLANGLDIGAGTPVNIDRATRQVAEQQLNVTRSVARNRANIQRLRARGLLSEARSAIAGGIVGGLSTGLRGAQLTGF